MDSLILFTAGTKAKAQEVNSNFSKVKSAIDTLEVGVTQAELDIESLDANKADINGNAVNVFNMANAVNPTHGINKQSLLKYTAGSSRRIEGLVLTKSTSNTVLISAGSAMDSTNTVAMALDGSVSVQNTAQAVDQTYYYYLIGKVDGNTTCIVSTEDTTPNLPSGYTYFRQIGLSYTTTDNVTTPKVNAISKLVSYSTPNNNIVPDYAHGVTRTWDATYTATCDGWVRAYATVFSGSSQTATLTIDGVGFIIHYASSGGDASIDGDTLFMPIAMGSTFKGSGGSNQVLTFYPKKGEV